MQRKEISQREKYWYFILFESKYNNSVCTVIYCCVYPRCLLTFTKVKMEKANTYIFLRKLLFRWRQDRQDIKQMYVSDSSMSFPNIMLLKGDDSTPFFQKYPFFTYRKYYAVLYIGFHEKGTLSYLCVIGIDR